MEQQGDVLLFQTLDNGDISVEAGIVEMSGGLETMAYLCLFGGNVQDDGTENTKQFAWVGNLLETDPARHLVSRTQKLLVSLPLIPGNLRFIDEAATLDLAIFLEADIASEVLVESSIPAINRVQIDVTINAFGQLSQFSFTENWLASLPTFEIGPDDVVPAPVKSVLVDELGGNKLTDTDANKLTTIS